MVAPILQYFDEKGFVILQKILRPSLDIWCEEDISRNFCLGFLQIPKCPGSICLGQTKMAQKTEFTNIF